MREKSTLALTLTEQEYQEAAQRFDNLADMISGEKEASDLREGQDIQLLSEEVIQFLRRLL